MTRKRTEIQHRGRVLQKEAAPPGSGVSTAGRDWFWLVLLIVPPLLIFPRLGDIYLWQDEAETALLGRAILEHGYPLAKLGDQLITDQPGQADLNSSGIWIWTPWLQNYLAALSFLLFGISTWSARLPFALVGWAALLVQYAALRDISRSRRLSRYATVLLLASVPFILHARQCRYYMLLALFAILHLWGYVRLTRRLPGGAALFVTGGIGLYYSFFPQLVASTAAMCAHALLFHRRGDFLRRFALWCAVIGAVCLPFFLYARGWSRDYRGEGHGFDSLWRYLASLRAYLVQVHAYGWPWLLAVPLLWRKVAGPNAARRRSIRTGITLLVLLLLATLCAPPGPVVFSVMGIVLAVLMLSTLRYFSAIPDSAMGNRISREEVALLALLPAVSVVFFAGISNDPFFRYLIGIVPILAAATAATVLALASVRRWIAVLLTACLLLYDVLQVGPFALLTGAARVSGLVSQRDLLASFGHLSSNVNSYLNMGQERPFPGLRSLAWEYAQELTHDYVGPIGGVVRYLQEHARPGQSIVTFYEHFPLMFYTELKVYSTRSGTDVGELPDWFLFHGGDDAAFRARLARAMREPGLYRRAPVPAHEYTWENIPEPHRHLFRTPINNPPVILFRRQSSGGRN